MSGLPKGWALGQLSDACVLINGRAYKQPELLEAGKYPVLRVGNFFSNRGWYYSDLELEDNKYCDNGDLLYAWSASFGPRIWDGGRVIYHYHIWKTQPDDRIADKRFLFHWFEWDKLNIQADHGTGSTMIHVTKGDMEARELALPPVPEQRRIVAKIDRLSARSRRARQELERTNRLAVRYRAAILSAAFQGSLTSDWRKGDEASWSTVEVGALIQNIQSGKNLRCEERPPLTGEKGVVKVSAVTWGKFDALQSKTLPPDYRPQERERIRAGDLLFSRANTLELVGACVIVGEAPDNLYLSDKVLRLDVDVSERAWLLWFLRSPEGRRQLEEVSSGNQLSMRNISQEGLRKVRIPIPPADERREIVRRIEHAFAAIDRLAAEATSARKLLNRLDQAVLAKAFRGELVPQDPNDEPASVLLEHIRAERAAAPAPKRGRRPKATL